MTLFSFEQLFSVLLTDARKMVADLKLAVIWSVEDGLSEDESLVSAVKARYINNGGRLRDPVGKASAARPRQIRERCICVNMA